MPSKLSAQISKKCVSRNSQVEAPVDDPAVQGVSLARLADQQGRPGFRNFVFDSAERSPFVAGFSIARVTSYEDRRLMDRHGVGRLRITVSHTQYVQAAAPISPYISDRKFKRAR